MPRYFSDLEIDTNGYLNLASDWDAPNDFDVSCRAMTRTAGTEVMLGRTETDSDYIACVSGNLSVLIGGQIVISASSVITKYQFHLIRLTRAGTTVTAFVDGVSVGSGTSSATFTISSFGHHNSGSLTFNGYIADVTLEDVTTPANTYFWAIDEATASTEDSTPSGNAATYVNVSQFDRYEFTEDPSGAYWWASNGEILELGDQQQPAAKVIMLAGQSNMLTTTARVQGIDDDYSGIQGRATQFAYYDQVRMPALDPLRTWGPITGTMGPWRNMMLGLTGRKLLVPVAHGATSFAGDDWNQGDPDYNAAVANTNAAYLSNSNNTEIEASVWILGESDAIAGNLNFLSDFRAMRLAMINDITAMDSNTIWVFVGILGPVGNPNISSINSDLQALAAEIPRGAYVSTDDLALYDTVHYDAPSMRIIGDRIAAAINSFGTLKRKYKVLRVG